MNLTRRIEHISRGQWLATCKGFPIMPVFGRADLNDDGTIEFYWSVHEPDNKDSDKSRHTKMKKCVDAVHAQLGANNTDRQVYIVLMDRFQNIQLTSKTIWRFEYTPGCIKLDDYGLTVHMTNGVEV